MESITDNNVDIDIEVFYWDGNPNEMSTSHSLRVKKKELILLPSGGFKLNLIVAAWTSGRTKLSLHPDADVDDDAHNAKKSDELIEFVKDKIEKDGISKVELAERFKTSETNIVNIFSRKSKARKAFPIWCYYELVKMGCPEDLITGWFNYQLSRYLGRYKPLRNQEEKK